MSTEEAIKKAKEAGFDLVLLTDKVSPPVTKIISYDKYRYQLVKEEKKKKQGQKVSELRKVRITPRIAEGDLERKRKQAEKFLAAGDKVETQIYLRGREKANRDFAKEKLQQFMDKIEVDFKVINPIKYAGRGFTMLIAPK